MKAKVFMSNVDVKGLDEMKDCAKNVLESANQLEDAIEELQQCHISCEFDVLERNEEIDEEVYEEFGEEDIDDILFDLNEIYFETSDVQMKMLLAKEIRELYLAKNK